MTIRRKWEKLPTKSNSVSVVWVSSPWEIRKARFRGAKYGLYRYNVSVSESFGVYDTLQQAKNNIQRFATK